MNNQVTNLIPIEQSSDVVAVAEVTSKSVGVNIWTDKDVFNQVLRAADMLSKTQIVPQVYQGKPQDCFVAIEMASRMDVSPMIVMQNLYVVKGKPSWAGQACIMLINSCGKFKNVRHIYVGEVGTESRGCYVEAEHIATGDKIVGATVTLKMAKDEGWTSNSKWRNMPELMLAYRASAFFARIHCPEALMGVQVEGEVEDIDKSNTASALTEALKGDTK